MKKHSFYDWLNSRKKEISIMGRQKYNRKRRKNAGDISIMGRTVYRVE